MTGKGLFALVLLAAPLMAETPKQPARALPPTADSMARMRIALDSDEAYKRFGNLDHVISITETKTNLYRIESKRCFVDVALVPDLSKPTIGGPRVKAKLMDSDCEEQTR